MAKRKAKRSTKKATKKTTRRTSKRSAVEPVADVVVDDFDDGDDSGDMVGESIESLANFVTPDPPRGGEILEGDRAKAKAYLEKTEAGETPTLRERESYQRISRNEEHNTRWEYYRSVPSHDVQALFGKTGRKVKEFYEKTGLPVHGANIDLVAVFRKLPYMGSESVRDRLDTAKAEKAEIEVQRLRGEMVDVDTAVDLFSRITSVMRKAGDGLKKAYGDDAAEILNEAIDDCVRMMDAMSKDESEGEGDGDI